MKELGVHGTGRYLPSRVVTNSDIQRFSGLDAGVIVQKLGILERRFAADEQSPSDMAFYSSKIALANASCAPEEISLIICCTFTSDYLYPALACKLHQMLKCYNAGSYDVVANCTGFQVGLNIAAGHFKLNPSTKQKILVCGVALQSRFIDFTDAETAPYFGDGAGAAVLGAVPAGFGILHSLIWTDSSAYDAVNMKAGGADFPPSQATRLNNKDLYYQMNGLEVWKQVIKNLPTVMRSALEQAGLTYKDVDFFIFHQANKNLIEYLLKKIGRGLSDTHLTLESYGNTADASIPITLSEAVDLGKIKRGDYVLISGIGAGFTFGVSLVRWY